MTPMPPLAGLAHAFLASYRTADIPLNAFVPHTNWALEERRNR